MCTLTIAYRALADAPVAVAANRDERYDRPSVAPRVVEGERRVVAPLDEEAGGTWIGYNDAGVLVAVTNRWTDADLAGERSRGLLVRDALARGSAEEAARAVEEAVTGREYAGFNLAVLDAETAVVFEWDGRLRITDLDPGIHVVLNAGFDDRFVVPEDRPETAEEQAGIARRIRETLRPARGETASEWLDRAAAVLSDHDYGVCVHGEGAGTRSSSLIALREGAPPEYRFAPGPPCRTEYRRVESGNGQV